VGALADVGTNPEQVTVGHCVRALELSLPQALAERCDPAESETILRELTAILDQLAAGYFGA
jgi:hypothetical protein